MRILQGAEEFDLKLKLFIDDICKDEFDMPSTTAINFGWSRRCDDSTNCFYCQLWESSTSDIIYQIGKILKSLLINRLVIVNDDNKVAVDFKFAPRCYQIEIKQDSSKVSFYKREEIK